LTIYGAHTHRNAAAPRRHTRRSDGSHTMVAAQIEEIGDDDGNEVVLGSGGTDEVGGLFSVKNNDSNASGARPPLRAAAHGVGAHDIRAVMEYSRPSHEHAPNARYRFFLRSTSVERSR